MRKNKTIKLRYEGDPEDGGTLIPEGVLYDGTLRLTREGDDTITVKFGVYWISRIGRIDHLGVFHLEDREMDQRYHARGLAKHVRRVLERYLREHGQF